ncbi:MAG: hypothetical protein AB7N76_12605 [Planctomycetota bacterium]
MARIPVSDAARLLNRTAGTIKKWIKEQGAPHDRLGPKEGYRVDPDEIAEWRDRKKREQKAARRQVRDLVEQGNLAPAPVVVQPPEPPEPEAPPQPKPRPEPSRPERASEVVEKVAPRAPAPTRVPRPRPVQGPPADGEAEEPDPMPADLRARVELSKVLSGTRSLVVTRVPVAGEGYEGLWGEADLDAHVAITETEFKQAIAAGGVLVLLQERLGPGTYRVEWIGDGAVTLHSSEIVIPSLKRIALDLELAEQRRRREEKEQARAEKFEARRRAAEAEHQERLAWEEREHQRWLEAKKADKASWVRACAHLGLLEATRRQRAELRRIRREIWKTECEHARAQAALSRRAQQVQRRELALQAAERAKDGGSARGRARREEQEPYYAPEPPDPRGLERLEAELARVQAWDLGAVHEHLLDVLELRADDLYPTPLYSHVVVTTIDPFLPPPSGESGFVPWDPRELLPPPPPPVLQPPMVWQAGPPPSQGGPPPGWGGQGGPPPGYGHGPPPGGGYPAPGQGHGPRPGQGRQGHGPRPGHGHGHGPPPAAQGARTAAHPRSYRSTKRITPTTRKPSAPPQAQRPE